MLSGVARTGSRSQAKRKAPKDAQGNVAVAARGGGATKRLRRRRSRKRVPMSDALRKEGLDERMVAETYAGVVATLKEKTDKEGGVEKLLVDILKECTRYLEPTRPTDRSGTGDTPVTVQLIHAVPRPERPPSPSGSKGGGEGRIPLSEEVA